MHIRTSMCSTIQLELRCWIAYHVQVERIPAVHLSVHSVSDGEKNHTWQLVSKRLCSHEKKHSNIQAMRLLATISHDAHRDAFVAVQQETGRHGRAHRTVAASNNARLCWLARHAQSSTEHSCSRSTRHPH